MNEENDINLKHLEENIGMGSCIGYYSSSDPSCKKCQIVIECKKRMKSINEEEKSEKKNKPKKRELSVVELFESEMKKEGYNKTDMRENDIATMFRFVKDNKISCIIFAKIGKIKVMTKQGEHILESFTSTEEIIDLIENENN